jgi:formylglycine-generating enzyme required for sulfatase activity
VRAQITACSLLLFAVATAFAACGDATFASDGVDGSTSDASSAPDSSDVADAADAFACPSGRGPAMIELPNGQCIDSTEVTNGQYQAFLAALAGEYDAGTDPRCIWKATDSNGYTPGGQCSADADLPVACVDWCDAFAYCAWAGKRLCGRVDGTSELTLTERTDPGVSQWFKACTANGTEHFPYGDSYDASACNTQRDGSVLEPPESFPGCVGGYPGIYDMAGNASEWVDSCDDSGAPQYNNCAAMGSSYVASIGSAPGRCDDQIYVGRNAYFPAIGFRCCSK